MYDVIIVGSGPAGVAGASALTNKKILLLDVGLSPEKHISLQQNFYDLRKDPESSFRHLIGENFESLNNICRQNLIPKLKSPHQHYIVAQNQSLGGLRSESFKGYLSYARGGLANAWGGQLYRFNDQDLRDFPIQTAELTPFYNTLTERIGISGTDDDLNHFYGPGSSLLPPLQLNALGCDLLRKYESRKKLFHQQDITLGRPRLGVLSVDYQGRKKCDYSSLEFVDPCPAHIYRPSITLDQLIAEKHLEYRDGYQVISYQETADQVQVTARQTASGRHQTFSARKLVLAAGTLGSAKIVLNANRDNETRLPLMENLLSYIPFLQCSRLGAPLQQDSFYTQLNLFYSGKLHPEPVMGTFYAISGILHSDILFDIPLPVRSSIIVSKYIIPATLVLHLWYPARPEKDNSVRLDRSGDLDISYQSTVSGAVERHLISVLRRIGYFSLPSLCKYPAPGNSFHYAGTLPMKERPSSPYETDRFGRLNGTTRISIADGACFPALPAKNLSMTIMANAMRICDQLNREMDTLP